MSTRINIGPVHPSTHGVLRLVADIEGDTVLRVEPHIGFLHRGVEKLVENRMYMQSPAYMEKLDYAAPMSYDELYVAVVEKAMGVEVKERAQWVRVVLLELQRIASHLLWLGTAANDLGQFFTLFMWCMKDRDMILRLLESASGARMFYVNMRMGGLVQDLPPGFGGGARDVLDYLERRVKKYEAYLEKNPVFMERTKGVGVLGKEDAINLGVTGPVLRASGVGYDTRKDNAYYVYGKLSFRPQTRSEGDVFARYRVRMMEIAESIRLVRDALDRMPDGDAIGMPVRLITTGAKNREASASRETPRGEGIMYMVADPQRPYRLAIRSPTFVNLAALTHIAKDCRLADVFAILGSLDIVMGDADK
jgi:NADH-quinone oxidoreductase subunit D